MIDCRGSLLDIIREKLGSVLFTIMMRLACCWSNSHVSINILDSKSKNIFCVLYECHKYKNSHFSLILLHIVEI